MKEKDGNELKIGDWVSCPLTNKFGKIDKILQEEKSKRWYAELYYLTLYQGSYYLEFLKKLSNEEAMIYLLENS